MPTVQRTPEVTAVIDAAKTGDNVVIDAGAGTGKTTTMVELANELPGRGLYIAYNAAIVAEAKQRFPSSVQCMTSHAIAKRKLVRGTAFQARLDNRQLIKPSDQAKILGITGPTRLSDEFVAAPWQLMRLINGTVRKFCHSADTELRAWHVPVLPGLEDANARQCVVDAVLPAAVKAWADLCNPAGKLPYSHDHYLKLWTLPDPVTGLVPQAKCSYILFDEAQDANACLLSLLLGQQSTQLIATGDQNQQLYSWRGAVNAMQQWPARHRLQLTQSWRFGPAIAHEANRWLELLDSDLRLTGNPALNSTLTDELAADAVLCRTNAGAFSQAMAAIQQGVKVAIVGKDKQKGGQEIIDLAQACMQLKDKGRTNHYLLYLFTSWGAVQDYVDQVDDQPDLKAGVDLIDAYGPEALIDAMNKLVDEADAQLVISTGHRSKGRQWNRVRVGDDFTKPNDEWDGDEGLNPADLMCAYVTVTRARQTLNRGSLAWIDGYNPRRAAA